MAETLKAGAMQVKAKDANRKAIAEVIQKANRKEISFSEFVTQTRELGGEVIFGELQVESEDKDRITELLEQFNTGKLNIDTFISKVREQGDKAEFWNYETGSNPRYAGNNESRIGFLYNPYYHVNGLFMQSIIKTAIKQALSFAFSIRSFRDLIRKYRAIKMIILFAHFNLTRHYDSNAYKYDDERMQRLERTLKENVTSFFQENIYKTDIMFKGMDILLFIMKEDIYWRGRVFALINEIAGVEVFKVTDEEKANIERWH